MEIFTLVLLFVFGLILGSYLNSWMWRVHEGKYVFLGRSMCVHCSRELTWWENVPLFSYLYLKGKCRSCEKPIPSSYFFVELAMAFLLAITASKYIFSNSVIIPLQVFRDLLFVGILVEIFVYDLKHQLILPGVIWLGTIAGAVINIFYLHQSWVSLAIGAVIGGGFFLAQYVVSKGRWIGGGDVRFGVMMGVWLGWQGTLLALFIAYTTGATISVWLLAKKKKGMNSAIPFGTFLAFGTYVGLMWGEGIIRWYIGLLK
jgi:prepilin signal peptidase PulO-like enzyme (type II secretory pathway)